MRFLSLLFLILCVSLSPASAGKLRDQRPNILLILADDHGVGAVGAYGPSQVETPNIDKLASQGLLLERAFCTNAVCSPARASLLTGKYSHRNGVVRFNTLLADQTMLPRELGKVGYRSAVIGKWHLGGNPGDVGFDQWEVIEIQGDYFDPEFRTPEGYRRHPGHATDVITSLALDYLRDYNGREPFFLCIHHKAPHDPFTPRPEDKEVWEDRPVTLPASAHDNWSRRSSAAQRVHNRTPGPLYKKKLDPSETSPVAEETLKQQLRDYFACVSGLDGSVGAILAELDRLGLSENTLVIYTSDHGMMTGQHGLIDKRMMYEDSIRIPVIIRWPGAVSEGARDNHLILNIDLAPTLLEVAGAKIPEQMQGRSFAALLKGDSLQKWRDSFYYRFYGQEPYRRIQYPAQIGVRTEKSKLIYFPETGEFEFYDLERDPDERTNAYDDPEFGSTIAELRQEITRLRKELGDEDQFAWAWTDLILPGERPTEDAYTPWPFGATEK